MNPDVKIMVATGLDSPSGGETAVPAGCRAVLKKPYATSRLLQTMQVQVSVLTIDTSEACWWGP